MQYKPVAQGWHGVANAIPENFLGIFYCCFIFATKERSPEILVELDPGLFDVPVSFIFSCTHIIYLIVIT